jgi:Fic family protein
MDELIGFVLGNRNREKILQVLISRGSMTAVKIAKLEHMPEITVNRILKELSERELLAVKGDLWGPTELGSDVSKELRRRT